MHSGLCWLKLLGSVSLFHSLALKAAQVAAVTYAAFRERDRGRQTEPRLKAMVDSTDHVVGQTSTNTSTHKLQMRELGRNHHGSDDLAMRTDPDHHRT